MKVINRIAACDDGAHRMRSLDAVRGLTVHHFGQHIAQDAAGIARFYRANAKWTGGQMPYTLVASPGGRLEQALPLREVGPHALRWSSPTVGLVAVGTFDEDPPSSVQWGVVVECAAELCAALGLDPLGKLPEGEWVLAGHTERRGGTRYKDKSCPGDAWDMEAFRVEVAQLNQEAALRRLAAAGITM